MSDVSLLRRLGGIVGGIVVAIITVSIVQAIGHRLYPPPIGTNIGDVAQVSDYVAHMPPLALSFVLLAWFLGALVGGWVGLRISRWRIAPWLVAGVILLGGAWSFYMIPHPVWMMAGGIALPLLAALLLSRRGQPG